MSRPSDEELRPVRREAMEFAGIGLFRYLFDGTVVFMDRRTLQILDLVDEFPDPAAVAGRNISSLFTYVSEPGSLRAIVRREGGVRGLEYHLKTLAGEDRWVLHNSYVVRDGDDRREAIQAVVYDITKRKLAEQALAQSEQRAAAVLQAIPDMVFRLTREGVFREYYAPSPDTLYVPPATIVGGKVTDLMPKIAEASLAAITETLATKSTVAFEYTLTFPDGEHFFEARHAPCGDDEVLAIVRDLTDQRRAEEERVRLVEQVQRAQRLESLGVLAGGIAHDFNNLLAAILGNAALMEDDIPAGSPACEDSSVLLRRSLPGARYFTTVPSATRTRRARPPSTGTLTTPRLARSSPQLIARPPWVPRPRG